MTDANCEIIAKDKHLLSLKDNNQTVNLGDLIDAGVSSFKIEGRLKEVDYVKNITAHYRKELDAVLNGKPNCKKASSGKSIITFAPNPVKSFSRGFTQYFTNDRVKGIGNQHTPKSLGEEVGQITSVARDYFTISSKEIINNGDGFCFITKNGDFEGFKVNRVDGDKLYPFNMLALQVGEKIYRNFDQKYSLELNKPTEKRVVAIDVSLSDTEEGFQINIVDEDGVSSEAQFIATKEISTNPNYSTQQLELQLAKFGNTMFEVKSVSVCLSDRWFLPNSVLNNFRREAGEAHQLKRATDYASVVKVVEPNDVPFPQSTLSYRANVINNKSREFYERHGVTTIDWGLEKYLPQDVDIEVMHTRHCILFEADLCLKKNPRGVKTPLFITNTKDTYRLEFDCFKCEMKVCKSH